MGREVRRVIPNWEHPKAEKYNPFTGANETRYTPLYDQSCEDAWSDWLQEFTAWKEGEHDRIISEYGEDDYPKDQPYASFCKWHGTPPDPEKYRPQWSEDEATWWQVYETVSEGTPVSPPLATQDELIEYLVKHGDFWDQKRREEGHSTMNCESWSREQAETFVKGMGWEPSYVLDSKGFRSGVEAITTMNRNDTQ